MGLCMLLEGKGTLVVQPLLLPRELLDALGVGVGQLKPHEPLLTQRPAAEVGGQYGHQRREEVVGDEEGSHVGGVVVAPEVAGLAEVGDVLRDEDGGDCKQAGAEDDDSNVREDVRADVDGRAHGDLAHEIGHQAFGADGRRAG